MKKTNKKGEEIPVPFMVRLYGKDLRAITNAAKRLKCSKAEVIRKCVAFAVAKAI